MAITTSTTPSTTTTLTVVTVDGLPDGCTVTGTVHDGYVQVDYETPGMAGQAVIPTAIAAGVAALAGQVVES